MIRRFFLSAVIFILMSFCLGSSAHAAAPEEQLVEAVKVALGKNFNTDWSGLDALPGIKAAPLPQDNRQSTGRVKTSPWFERPLRSESAAFQA